MKLYASATVDAVVMSTCSRMDLASYVAAATLSAMAELAAQSVTDIKVDYAGKADGGGYLVRLVGESAEGPLE